MTTLSFLKQLAGNRIFSVEYKKVSGEKSKMTGRFSVKKGVNGKGLRYSASEKNNACIFNMHKRAYRSFKIDNIISVKINGVVLTKEELDRMCIVHMMREYQTRYNVTINEGGHQQVA